MCLNCVADKLYKADDIAASSSIASAALPTYSMDQIADYLTDGYWADQGWSSFKFNVSTGGTLYFNVSNLSADGKFFARAAMESWANATGINFVETNNAGLADIAFENTDQSGAYSTSTYSGGYIIQSTVNIPSWWYSGDEGELDNYSFQTYIHEVGHAIGLGHSGNYNGNATYGIDNDYLNDSWQASIMSYFSQTENTSISATYAYVVTPMMADHLAVHSLYGTPTNVHLGDTVYGNNSTAGGYMDDLADASVAHAMTIYDNGGIDTIDMSHSGATQVINLVAEVASNVRGATGNLFIARGVEIENAIGGSGSDTLNGNDLNNDLRGGAGADTLNGGDGDDTLGGGSGADELNGGAGVDTADYADQTSGVGVHLADNNAWGSASGDSFTSIENVTGTDYADQITGTSGANVIEGGAGNDTLDGRQGADTLRGGAGNDTLNGGWGAQDDILDGGDGDDILNGDAGNDTLIGGLGGDTYNGGDGLDTADFRDVDGGGVGVNLIAGNGWGKAAGDSFNSVENIWGSLYNDKIVGTNDRNVLIGGGGHDNVDARGGNDVLYGGWGHDVLDGGAGNDYLNGGHYNDTYTGGDGADTFVFNQHEDVITDYDADEGDRLQFDDALWGGGAKTDAELLAYATVAGGDIVFDFGYGHTLTLEGTTDLDALNGQMQIY